MAENVPHLEKEKDIQLQEAQRVPNKPTSRHIIIKMAKVKEDSKGSKGKTKSYLQGNPP